MAPQTAKKTRDSGVNKKPKHTITCKYASQLTQQRSPQKAKWVEDTGVPDDSDEGNDSDDNNNKNNDESKMTGVEKDKAELLLLGIQTRDRRKEGSDNQKNDGQDIAED